MRVDDVFAAIRDQDEAVALLRRAVSAGRVAHAYAFVGPSGVGRKLTAVAFAKALVAPSGGTAAARVDRGAHPDVRLIQPTPPDNNPKGPLAVRIESIRALERLANLRPVEAPWKVFIVDEAERMTAATPQAFLKTLEEPPDRTVIILILSQLRALPLTVLSRCQIVRFRPRHAVGVPALLPDGRDSARVQALSVLAAVDANGVEAILDAGDNVGKERQAAETLVESCWLWYRDRLCEAAGATEHVRVFGDTRTYDLRERSLDELLTGITACREAWQALQGNVSPRLTIEMLLNRLRPAAA